MRRQKAVSILSTRAHSHAVPLKVGFLNDTSSSAWRTAYEAATFETDSARITLRIAGARVAITERLNSPIEISELEHESIEAARKGLTTLETERVDVARSVPTNAV
jgi:hypothetical protein